MLGLFYFATVNTISIIVAKAKDNAIGKDNKLLWRIRDDLILFKSTTNGHVVIHGRKSFESIGKPLPNRTNIVITRNKNYQPKGAFVVHSLNEALKIAEALENKNEVFILGGAEIYRQSLDVANKLYISHVDVEGLAADAYFPEYDETKWLQKQCASYSKSDTNEYAFSFCEYERST